METSKFLPTTDLKVTYHNLVINAFMKYFGIIPESPALMLDPPILQYLIVSINNQNPIVIRKNQPLEIAAGDNIKIMYIEANYERGLSLEEVQINLSQKQEIFLQINGQKIKTGEVKRVKDLFLNSSNKQTIEIKNGPMLLGSFVIEIG